MSDDDARDRRITPEATAPWPWLFARDRKCAAGAAWNEKLR
jgi:hypothetical protein